MSDCLFVVHWSLTLALFATFTCVQILAILHRTVFQTLCGNTSCKHEASRYFLFLPETNLSDKYYIKFHTNNNWELNFIIFVGNSELGALVWSYLGYLICLRYLFRSCGVTNKYFYFSLMTYRFHILPQICAASA